MIVTGGIDNIRVWDVNSGQVMQRITLGRIDKNKETLVWCLAITSYAYYFSFYGLKCWNLSLYIKFVFLFEMYIIFYSI